MRYMGLGEMDPHVERTKRSAMEDSLTLQDYYSYTSCPVCENFKAIGYARTHKDEKTHSHSRAH